MNGNLLLLCTYFNQNIIKRLKVWCAPAWDIKLPGPTNVELTYSQINKNRETKKKIRPRFFRPQIQMPDFLF